MKQQNIRIVFPTRLCAEVMAIMARLAAEIEFGANEKTAKRARVLALTELCAWMERHEAQALIDIFSADRQRCMTCNKAAQLSRSSGALCLWCARKLTNEVEAQHV